MNVAQLKARCTKFAGASETLHGAPSNILVYAVGAKTFAYFKTSEPERWRFSMRVTPDRFLELTDRPGIIPAPYLARAKWVRVDDLKTLSDVEAKELLTRSYELVFGKLTKKLQREIQG